MSEAVQSKETAIAAVRSQIDRVDVELVRLLARRADLAHQIGVIKGGDAVYRPEREQQVLERVVKESGECSSRLSAGAVRAVFREIMSSCRAVESRPRVAYLGPAGTFTEMAAIAQFGHEIEGIACSSIDEVFRKAETGAADFAVVPVENTTQGTITRTLDLLFVTSLTVVGEVNVDICHNLMNQSGRLEDVRQIQAHPQALGQCRMWLSSHAGGIPQQPAASNAAAAVEASRDPSVAAICASRAAELYGLKIIEAGVQDDPRNRTRFFILGKASPAAVSAVPYKTSIVFSVPNTSGSLFKAIEPFSRHGVQMVRLESRPAKNGAWEYNFYVDVEGHPGQSAIDRAIEEVRSRTSVFKILGMYPEARK